MTPYNEIYSLEVLIKKYGAGKTTYHGEIFEIKREGKIVDQIVYADLSIAFRKRGKFKKILFSNPDFIVKFDNMIRWFEDEPELKEKPKEEVQYELKTRLGNDPIVDDKSLPIVIREWEVSTSPPIETEIKFSKQGTTHTAGIAPPYHEFPKAESVELPNHTEQKIPRKKAWLQRLLPMFFDE